MAAIVKKSSPVSEQVVPRSCEIDLLLVHGAGILRIAAAFHSLSVSRSESSERRERSEREREERERNGRETREEPAMPKIVCARTYRSAQVQRGCYSFTHRRVVLVRPSNSALLLYCCFIAWLYGLVVCCLAVWPRCMACYGAESMAALVYGLLRCWLPGGYRRCFTVVQPLEYNRSRVHCDVHLTFRYYRRDKFAHPRARLYSEPGIG